MKIYIDKNNRVKAFEIIFEKDLSVYKENHLKGKDYKGILISENDYQFIIDNLNKGLKIDDFVFDGKKVIINKISSNNDCIDCLPYLKNNFTVIVDLSKFKVNSDLKRHLKNINDFYFKLDNNFDFSKIDKSKLNFKDAEIINLINKKKFSIKYDFFVLFDKEENFVGFCLVFLEEIPKIIVFYSYIEDGGYILFFNIIKFYKSKYKYLDLGGLTKEDSGINQFKKKWGMVVSLKDLFLFKG